MHRCRRHATAWAANAAVADRQSRPAQRSAPAPPPPGPTRSTLWARAAPACMRKCSMQSAKQGTKGARPCCFKTCSHMDGHQCDTFRGHMALGTSFASILLLLVVVGGQLPGMEGWGDAPRDATSAWAPSGQRGRQAHPYRPTFQPVAPCPTHRQWAVHEPFNAAAANRPLRCRAATRKRQRVPQVRMQPRACNRAHAIRRTRTPTHLAPELVVEVGQDLLPVQHVAPHLQAGA